MWLWLAQPVAVEAMVALNDVEHGLRLAMMTIFGTDPAVRTV